jgi:AraC-like DNA-binding protein
MTSELRHLLEYGLDQKTCPPRVSEFTRRLRIPRRTLASRLQRAGLVAPRDILHWCVVLRATNLLCHTEAPVERVSDQLGLPEPHSLRRLLRHYLGFTPRALRHPQQWRGVVETFGKSLDRGPPDRSTRMGRSKASR